MNSSVATLVAAECRLRGVCVESGARRGLTMPPRAPIGWSPPGHAQVAIDAVWRPWAHSPGAPWGRAVIGSGGSTRVVASKMVPQLPPYSSGPLCCALQRRVDVVSVARCEL